MTRRGKLAGRPTCSPHAIRRSTPRRSPQATSGQGIPSQDYKAPLTTGRVGSTIFWPSMTLPHLRPLRSFILHGLALTHTFTLCATCSIEIGRRCKGTPRRSSKRFSATYASSVVSARRYSPLRLSSPGTTPHSAPTGAAPGTSKWRSSRGRCGRTAATSGLSKSRCCACTRGALVERCVSPSRTHSR
jgi:hypothetical protein